MDFWRQLSAEKKPFFVLAPMADVTDMAFRQIVIDCGRPDVLYTEFVSTDGLCSDKGRPCLLPHLKFQNNERPIVAQFFGSKPENFRRCAELAVELGFDGIDINMGCPDRKVMKQGSGASLVLNPELAQKIVAETKRGAGQLPVSVKTRLGYDKIVTDAWMRTLVDSEPAAILLHGRTAKEMSKVPAHWDEIGKAAAIVREAGIPFVGNGDVASYQEGIEKAEQYGLDGIMVGRGIFANPWFFNPTINPTEKTKEERIALMRRHVELFRELWGENKNFDVLKRFFKIYIKDFDGSKELRDKLMTAKSKQDVDVILSASVV
ncbi:MAG TPA: tRNA-dihydrouridine synthase [Candidatus Paceibacterota bacterium]|nr:tRNA-dihydrouridine synthase [Candidatus Paceibacterota bacterium]